MPMLKAAEGKYQRVIVLPGGMRMKNVFQCGSMHSRRLRRLASSRGGDP